MNTGHGTIRARALWAQLAPGGRIALAVATFAALVLILSSRGLIGALFTPAAGAAGAGADDLHQRAEQFSKSFDQHLAQINGRSMIFKPLPPVREGPKTEANPVAQAPTHYGGPALVGFVNGAAYFADGKKLAPGESGGSSLKVTAINPPWSATVEWEGVEFTVGLFDRDKVVYKEAGAATVASSSPEPEAAKEDTAQPASPAKADTAEPKPPRGEKPASAPEAPKAVPADAPPPLDPSSPASGAPTPPPPAPPPRDERGARAN